MFVDAHLHMTDSKFDSGYDDIFNSKMLFSCTSKEEEWNLLKNLCKNDHRIIPFYGIHPWFVDSGLDIHKLESILKTDSKANIGEIGLDFGKPSPEKQITYFTEQLELAEKYDRIVSIHMIKCESEMLRVLRKHSVKGILHSFAGPESYIKPFAKCGCYFSISPITFLKSPEKIRSILVSIPRDKLLIETDAPNNRYITMSQHAKNMGNVLCVTSSEVLDLTLKNAEKLIS